MHDYVLEIQTDSQSVIANRGVSKELVEIIERGPSGIPGAAGAPGAPGAPGAAGAPGSNAWVIENNSSYQARPNVPAAVFIGPDSPESYMLVGDTWINTSNTDPLVSLGNDAMMTAVANDSTSAFAGKLASSYVGPLGKTSTGSAAPQFYINVKDYGAVGNNVANDTVAIQAAIDAAAALSGTVVLFPRGTYKITTTLLLPSHIALVGLNQGSQINGPSKIVWGGADGGVMVGPKDRTIDTINCGIEGLQLDGGGLTAINIDWYRISYGHFYNVLLSGMKSVGGCGVQYDANVINQCYFNTVRNSKVSGGEVGVRYQNGANVNLWQGGVVNQGKTGFVFLSLASGNIIDGVDLENNSVCAFQIDAPSNMFRGNHVETVPIGANITANGHDTRWGLDNTFSSLVTTWIADASVDGVRVGYISSDNTELRLGATSLKSVFLTSTTSVDFDPKTFSGTSNSLVRTFRNVTTTGTRSHTFYKGDGTGTQAFLIDAGKSSISVGDVAIGGATGIGIANGTAPTSNPVAGGVMWATAGVLRYRSSTGTIRTISGDIAAISTSTTLNVNSPTVLATGGAAGINAQLPAAVAGSEFVIKKVDSGAGAVTVTTTSSQTIDGASTKVLSIKDASVRVVSDGTNWFTSGGGDVYAPLPKTGRNPLTGMFHADGYGAVGDGSTDNTTAIQAAYAACVAAGGGTIYFPARSSGVADYRFGSSLDFRSTTVPITFRGDSGMGDGGAGVSLTYTGTGTTAAIRFGSSRNMTFEKLSVSYNSGTFTGRLLDGQKTNPGSDTAYITFSDCAIGGATGISSASMGVCIDGSHDVQFTRVRWLNAGIGLVGKLTQGITATGGYAIRVNLDACSFAGLVTAGISNADESWDVNAVFEPLVSGAAGAYVHDAGVVARGLTFRSCWLGDDSGTVAGSWIKWAGTGLSVDGGLIGVNRLTTGIQFDGNTTASTRIRTNFSGGGGTNKGVDFGSTTGHSGVQILSSFKGIAQPIAGTVPAGTLIDTGDGTYVSSPEFSGPIISGRLGPNLLTTNQASPNTTTGFTVNGNSTLSASGGVFTMTSSSTFEPSVFLASVPITAGKQYTFQAEVDPGANAGRFSMFDIGWLDAGGTTLSSSLSGLSPLTAGGGYQAASASAVAPAGATQARVILRIGAPVTAGEAYNYRKLSFHRGTLNTWALPGAVTGAASLDAGVGLELPEITSPAAPGTDLVRVYAKDNGSGKTQITARFQTGTELPILTEGDTPLLPASIPRTRMTSGYFYVAGPESARSTFQHATDKMLLTAFDCPYGGSIDQLFAEITTVAAAGGRLRLGVYADSGNGLPTTLLVDAGDLDATASTGVKTITLGSTLVLTGAVRVWLAAAVQTASATMRTVGASGDRRVGAQSAAAAVGVNGQNAYVYNAPLGALPTTLSGASITVGTQGILVGARAV